MLNYKYAIEFKAAAYTKIRALTENKPRTRYD
jgi:hypothetical protein